MVSNQVFQTVYYYATVIRNAYSLNELIFLFFLYSLAGWLIELIYRSISQRKLVNPGFLKGPFVPLYGLAGLFISITILFSGNLPLIFRLGVYFSVITVMEFITGEFVLRLFKKRLWDYTTDFMNLRGHICLPFSVGWGILSLVFEKTIYPLAILLVYSIDSTGLMIVNGLALFLLQIDLIYSTGFWHLVIDKISGKTGMTGLIRPLALFSFRIGKNRLIPAIGRFRHIPDRLPINRMIQDWHEKKRK